jgi:tight adherence protein B
VGALLGLCTGLGALLLVSGLRPTSVRRPPTRARVHEALRGLVDDAGLSTTSLAVVPLAVAGCGVVVGVLVLGVSRSTHLAACFAAVAGYAPLAVLRSRGRRRRDDLVHVWPDVVDDLTSAVRAGLALPEALAQLGEGGPVELRPAFARFGADYRAGGRFADSLDRLKADLADPAGDRVVEALRIAREVGGNDLGGLLRTLSQFLRDDARLRGELHSRQAWTVNGARLAVAAPWLVLAMLATRPQAVSAYDTTTGAVVLVVGGLLCVLAYRVMVRIGRLPTEPRVLA